MKGLVDAGKVLVVCLFCFVGFFFFFKSQKQCWAVADLFGGRYEILELLNDHFGCTLAREGVKLRKTGSWERSLKSCLRVVVILQSLDLVNQPLFPGICAFCNFEDINYITSCPTSVHSEANFSALDALPFWLMTSGYFHHSIPLPKPTSSAKLNVENSLPFLFIKHFHWHTLMITA